MPSDLPALIISSEARHRDRIAEIICKRGLRPVFCPSLADACAIVAGKTFPLIFCSDELPDSDLRTSLRSLAVTAAGVPVIVLSHLAEWDAYVIAIGAGAFDYIACPPDPVETERIVRLALNQATRTQRASRAAA